MPLIREYTDLHAPKVRPPLTPEDEARPRKEASERKKIEIDWVKVRERVDQWKRPVVIGLGVIFLLVMVVNGVTRCSRRITEPKPVVAPPVEEKVALPVLREPPDPYIETSRPVPQTP